MFTLSCRKKGETPEKEAGVPGYFIAAQIEEQNQTPTVDIEKYTLISQPGDGMRIYLLAKPYKP